MESLGVSANEFVFALAPWLAALTHGLSEWQDRLNRPMILIEMGIAGELVMLFCTATAALGTISLFIFGIIKGTWYIAVPLFFLGGILYALLFGRSALWLGLISNVFGPPLLSGIILLFQYVAWTSF